MELTGKASFKERQNTAVFKYLKKLLGCLLQTL
jgi:hypothetical protein